METELYTQFTAKQAKELVKDYDNKKKEFANIKWNIKRLATQGISSYTANMISRKFVDDFLLLLQADGFEVSKNQLCNGYDQLFILWF